MARWRAVPTAVSTAVGALAFLASAGLAVVLGAGLHVWGGSAVPAGLSGQRQPGSVTVTHRVGGVVTVPQPVTPAQRPQTGPSAPGPTTSLPFIPFVPSAPAAAPPTSTPAVPPATGQGTAGTQLQRSGHGHPLTLRAFLNELRRAGSTGEDSDGLRALRQTGDRQALRAEQPARTGKRAHGHTEAREAPGHGKGHARAHRHGARHHHRGHGSRHHGHGHGHGHGDDADDQD
jgi:hypothetical protein